MDKPISVGDLVVVVRYRRCGCPDRLGQIFRVTRLQHCPAGTGGYCLTCNAHDSDLPPFWVAHGGPDTINVERLKRIPPLSELESEKRDEEITA